MTLDDLLEDGMIDEVRVTKNELRTILLDGIDRVNDPDDDLEGISYGLNDRGIPSIGFSFMRWSYDEVEVKLK